MLRINIWRLFLFLEQICVKKPMKLGTINNLINQRKCKGVYSCVNLPMPMMFVCAFTLSVYFILCVYVCSNIFVTELNAT